MIGQTISHYKILEKLGEGGMGVVYKAHDTRLDRAVALKFLPADLTRDAEAKERFSHEAKASSSLDHPNICTTYEIGETDDGRMFMAMACYEGETLKRKIENGPMKIELAIEVAIQVARGLEKAHDRGIIHRDIKPANIFITDDEVVKILDFGLAKLKGLTKLTRTGSTLGTAAYISPEQALGEEVDPRTDIWSLGVVMYEAITGQLPFKGGYENAIIYSIENVDPEPMTALRTGVPMELERIVEKCLEKNPDHRFQDVLEFIVDLQRLKRGSESRGRKIASPPIFSWNSARIVVSKNKWLILAIAVTIVTVEVIHIFLLSNASPPPMRDQTMKERGAKLPAAGGSDYGIPRDTLVQLTMSTGVSDYASLSPDGKWIAYASDERGSLDIWRKPLSGGQAERLTSGPGNENQPSWSPDGRTIAYSSDSAGGGIFVIPSHGGQPTRLTQIGTNPSWSPDNKKIAFSWNGNILVVPYPQRGGVPKPLVSGTSAARHIAWSSDGSRIVFWHRTRGDIFIYSMLDSTTKPMNLITSGSLEVSGLAWAKDRNLLVYSIGPFGGDKTLMKVEVNSSTGMPVHLPEPFLGHFGSTTDDVHCSFSYDGSKLVFTARQVERQIWAVPIDLATGLAIGKGKQITSSSRLNEYPAVSPDGHLLAWTSHQVGSGHLYQKNLSSGIEKKVTTDWRPLTRESGASFSPVQNLIAYASTMSGPPFEIYRITGPGSVDQKITETKQQDVHPAWSPKEEKIAFYSNRSGNWDIWTVPVSGKGEPKQLTDAKSNEMYPAWSSDGRWISFTTDREERNGSADIWIMGADGSNPRPYVVGVAEEGWSSWSPNGRFFYFSSNRSGVFNIWVQSVSGSDIRQVTHYEGYAFGLPEQALFTKFAVSKSFLFIPVETRKGNIYVVEGFR